MNYRLPLLSLATFLAVVGGIGSAAAAPSSPGPAQNNHADAIRYSSNNPNAAPPGANEAGCLPTQEHPRPVILVHGTDGSAYSDWAGFSPALVAAGYCVYALNYGASPDGTSYGFGDIRDSAQELKEFTQSVLAGSGAEKADLIGYSQGAAVTRYYTNRLGGADSVDKWIGIASPTYGGTAYGLSPVIQRVPVFTKMASSQLGPALVQLMQGSSFLTELNSGGDTVPGVEYTSIATAVDETIQPYTNALFRDGGVHNVVVQDVCPQDNVAHFTFTYDPTTLGLVLDALDPAAEITPLCTSVPLGAGILEVVIASN